MIVRKEIDLKKPPTEKQLKMLKAMEERPIVFDDSPELTAEQLSKLRRVSETRRGERKKQTVTLRLSPNALNTARSLGKGYTSVLSRILESALKDEEILKKYL